MKVSIGILAHNEEKTLRKTLDSLFQQSLLQPGDQPLEIEIICVPNGCHDRTGEVAREIFTELAQTNEVIELAEGQCRKKVTWQVCELAQPGKPNAWNHYVHQFADPNSDYIMLMDADIWFDQTQTLTLLVDFLEQHPEVRVAVDQPIKDVILKTHKNLLEHLSTFVSELSGSGGAAWLCGQLYCARADILRKIYMPAELSVDDGFLYQMVTTDCLTMPSQPDLIAKVPAASHVFEAYINPRQLIKHERWLVVSNITNDLIFEHVNQNHLPALDPTPSSNLFRHWDQQNPHWVKHLIQEKLTSQVGWISPPAFLGRRFMNLRRQPLFKALTLLPLAIAALCVDLITLYAANRQLTKMLSSEQS
jgi:hypothetical protein